MLCWTAHTKFVSVKIRPMLFYSCIVCYVIYDTVKCIYYVVILLCAGCTGICGSFKTGWSVLLIGSEPAAVQAAVNGWCN